MRNIHKLPILFLQLFSKAEILYHNEKFLNHQNGAHYLDPLTHWVSPYLGT